MNKEMLSQTIPVIQDSKADRPAYSSKPSWKRALNKVWSWFRGEKKKTAFISDPAADVIALIANQEVASIVRDLHYKTPRSLMAMRKSCQECFMLPDDCPYYDYSIFDVKKAIKTLAVHPRQIQFQIVKELQNVNTELSHHLKEHLE
jgi:hypothetical protein